ncbi:MAG: hypothetical protein KAU36_02200, partial [candidate division Zixibacteria bacterium]|nr:hypothetical protein [candidate division Zixibacteria bacterium]
IDISATDPDGGTPALYATAIPTGATFTDNGDGTGNFYWMPEYGQAGAYIVTFGADDGTDTAEEVVTITVVTGNLPPVLAYTGPQTTVEGDTLVIDISAIDPDGGPPMLIAERMPDTSLFLEFVDNGDGTGRFRFTPGYIQAGLTSVTFRAYDGMDDDKEIVLIQVYDGGNQPPIFDSIPSPLVTEGETLTGGLTAHDPDTLSISYTVDESIVSLPENFTLEDGGDGVAYYTFTPGYTQAGMYDIYVVASDGVMADTIVMTISVLDAGNQPPVLDPIPAYSVRELQNLTFGVSASDPDEDFPPRFTAELPGTAGLTDLGDGTGFFSWTPGAFDAGDWEILITALDANDDALFDTQTVFITVLDTNRAPSYFTPVSSVSMNEGETLEYLIYAWDVDSTLPGIAVVYGDSEPLPPNMSFSIVNSGDTMTIGTLIFNPDFTQGTAPVPNLYEFRVQAIDQADPELTSPLSEPKSIMVYDYNPPPTLEFSPSSGPFNIAEGGTLFFTVAATDINGTVASLTAANLPLNATFTGSNTVKTLQFNPDYTQAGTYSIDIVAVDDEGASTTVTVIVNVGEAGNQRPSFTTEVDPDVDVFVGTGLELHLVADDPEAEPVTLSVTPELPEFFFVDSGNGAASFSYYPDVTLDGTTEVVSFVVTDVGGAADTIATTLHVRSMLRGDADADEVYTMNDIVYIIGFLFREGEEPSPPDAGDVDRSGTINVADVAYLINYMYRSGPRPPQ